MCIRDRSEVDGALDGVFDGDESGINIATSDGVEYVGHGAKRHQFTDSKIGLSQESLLSESAEWSEEPDAHWCCCHECKGYALWQPPPPSFS